MAFSIVETKAKILRIKELESEGLNTPRMYFLECDVNDFDFDLAIKWAKKINKEEPNQIFNIRTYSRQGKNETLNTVHYTDIKYEDLFKILVKANMKYHCMIDAETPDAGRLAGNGIIFTDYIGKPSKILIEYCKKKKRAMVRDELNHSIECDIENIKEKILDKEPKLQEVVDGLKKFSKKDVIIEWTYFAKPSGIISKNTVFWEYRKFGG